MLLEGKIAILTGASSGIGRASALVFAREGAKVVLADIQDEQGEQIAQQIHESGGEALYVHTDVTKAEDARSLVETAVEAYGRVDVLFNNAGIAVFKAAAETTEDEWDRVLGVNLKGVWLCSKYAIPHMQRQGGGVIINTASVHSQATAVKIAAYAASKGGVLQLTKSMALDYAKDNIRVNCIFPGAIETPLMRSNLRAVNPNEEEEYQKTAAHEPLGRVGRPEEIAKATVFLASDYATFVTGAPLIVDGGLLAQL
jgi:NAD(P)-dependent dehydrogenase (short-subunit alcohol dehydrogenase family)